MRDLATSFPAIFSVFLLAACGGGSSTGSQFSNAIADAAALSDAAMDQSIKDPLLLPAFGSATYEGTMAFTINSGAAAAGELSLTARFESNSIDGSATNFIGSGKERFTGSLDISNGEILRDVDISEFYVFAAELDGQLFVSDEPVDINGSLFGDFRGDDHRFIDGVINGDVVFLGETSRLENGLFVGKRD